MPSLIIIQRRIIMNHAELTKMAEAFKMFSMFTQMSQGLAQEVPAESPVPAPPVAPTPCLTPIANVRTPEETTSTFLATAEGKSQMDVTLAEVSVLMLHDHKVFTKFKNADDALVYLTEEALKSTAIPAVGMVRGKEVNFRAGGKADGKITSKFSLASWDATNSVWQNWDRSLRIFFDEKAKSNHKTAYELVFKNERSYAMPVRNMSKEIKDRGLNARKASSKTAMQQMDQRVGMVAPQIVDLAKGCSVAKAREFKKVLELAIKEIDARIKK
jgi:hypothetical protein